MNWKVLVGSRTLAGHKAAPGNESNTCKLVEGNISPTGWCVIWAKMA